MGLVLVFHLWPAFAPGGFVGVDVFFVISGYLITGHLVREIRGQTFTFRAFYARRIRRLFPAALLVLGVTFVATVALAPRAVWPQYLSEIAASAVSVENWLLAANAVDYLAGAAAPSPVQHFWSLSVEEQFYLLWPLILVAAFAVARTRRRGLAIALGGILIASFAWSVLSTTLQPAIAYFSTVTRAWEFAAGGLLALVLADPRGAGLARRVPGWIPGVAGVVAIVAATALLSASSPFPGYRAALPVLGAVLVIVAGEASSGWFRLASAWRPVQYLGSISYSVYLWHWPLLILSPFALAALGAPGVPEPAAGVVILGITLALAALTRRFVEVPLQRHRAWVAPKSRRPFVVAAAGAVVLVAAGAVALTISASVTQRVESAVAASVGSSCHGAAAMDAACPDPFAVTDTVDPTFASRDIGVGVAIGRCEMGAGSVPQPPCEFGELTSPTHTIALVGDSHAGHLIEVIEPIAQREGWKLIVWAQGSCPGIGVLQDSSCAAWGRAVVDQILADPTIDTVLVTNATSKYKPDVTQFDATAAAADLRTLQAAKLVVVVRDTPGSFRGSETEPAFNVSECLSVTRVTVDPCTVPRGWVVTEDRLMEAAAAASAPVIDLSDRFCTDDTCHAVIGGLAVYADGSHLTVSFARTLAPYFGEQLREILERS